MFGQKHRDQIDESCSDLGVQKLECKWKVNAKEKGFDGPWDAQLYSLVSDT